MEFRHWVCNKLLHKQETLEEAADKLVFEANGHRWSNNDDTAGDNYGSFKAGAKWMEEQMESLKDFETWKEWKNNILSIKKLNKIHFENT